MALSTVRRAAFVTLDLQPLICSFMDDSQRDAPEIHESHPIMGPAKQGNVLVDGTPEAALLPELARSPGLQRLVGCDLFIR